jgi:uncharacterized protein (DUF433 family)
VRQGFSIALVASLLDVSRAAAAHLARRGEQFLKAVCGAEEDMAEPGMSEHEHGELRIQNMVGVRDTPTAHVDAPLYSPAELGRYLLLPVTTVRGWTLGWQRERPLIHSAAWDENLLSFRNACEVHVLSALPWALGRRVPLAVLGKVVRKLRELLSSEHPFADVRMRGGGKDAVAAELRLAGFASPDDTDTARAIDAYAARIERDDRGEPIRLRLCTQGPDGPEHVTLDPTVNSGKPCITGTRLATATVWEQFRAGTSLKRIVENERVSWEAVEEAIRYETGAP